MRELMKELRFLKTKKLVVNMDSKNQTESFTSWLRVRDSTEISFNFYNSLRIFCRSIMVRNSVPSLDHLNHPHPPFFLLVRSTPMSFHVVWFVPNLSSFDLDWSTCMCFLSCLSYSHFCFSFSDSYLRFPSSALCCLWTLISKSYLS